MTHDVEGGVAARSRVRPGTPDQVDRILVIASIVLWLAALGAGVAAVVALVGLAKAHTVATGESPTPWLLYTVIGVSAVVIVGAIPLLLRARQTATGVGPRVASQSDGIPSDDAPSLAQRVQPFGAPVLSTHSTPPAGGRVGFPTAAVDQVWLRCTASIAAAMGFAMTGIGVATYLMASDHDTAAWAIYVVVGLVTVAMPAAPWFYLRELRNLLDRSN
jgi:hypothetical protein